MADKNDKNSPNKGNDAPQSEPLIKGDVPDFEYTPPPPPPPSEPATDEGSNE